MSCLTVRFPTLCLHFYYSECSHSHNCTNLMIHSFHRQIFRLGSPYYDYELTDFDLLAWKVHTLPAFQSAILPITGKRTVDELHLLFQGKQEPLDSIAAPCPGADAIVYTMDVAPYGQDFFIDDQDFSLYLDYCMAQLKKIFYSYSFKPEQKHVIVFFIYTVEWSRTESKMKQWDAWFEVTGHPRCFKAENTAAFSGSRLTSAFNSVEAACQRSGFSFHPILPDLGPRGVMERLIPIVGDIIAQNVRQGEGSVPASSTMPPRDHHPPSPPDRCGPSSINSSISTSASSDPYERRTGEDSPTIKPPLELASV